MARSLGVALLSTALSLTFGCSFFQLEDKDLETPPKKPAAAAGTPGAAGVATMGYAGFLAGPPLLGWLAEPTSLRVVMGVIVVLAVLTAVLARATNTAATARTRTGNSS